MPQRGRERDAFCGTRESYSAIKVYSPQFAVHSSDRGIFPFRTQLENWSGLHHCRSKNSFLPLPSLPSLRWISTFSHAFHRLFGIFTVLSQKRTVGALPVCDETQRLFRTRRCWSERASGLGRNVNRASGCSGRVKDATVDCLTDDPQAAVSAPPPDGRKREPASSYSASVAPRACVWRMRAEATRARQVS